jgi:OmpA-OmpF porin, OOP family
MGDFQDIYVSPLTNSVPGPGVNLGSPVNSIWPDGEQAVTADGQTLYISSTRPGGFGGSDIYISQWNGSAWSAPVNAGNTINSAAEEKQPCLTVDGQTMYYTGERSFIPGIYRSTLTAGVWSTPELVIQGIGVGEPSLTADGQYLYFVYVYVDSNSQVYDADIYYLKKK